MCGSDIEELADDLPKRLLVEMAMIHAEKRAENIAFQAENYFVSAS